MCGTNFLTAAHNPVYSRAPMDSEPNYIFNFSHSIKVVNVVSNKVEQVVAPTIDAAFIKFRAAFPDAEVTQIQRTNTVTV